MLPKTLQDHTHYILLSGIELFMDPVKFRISPSLSHDINISSISKIIKDKFV